jgi:hypothetical protein
MYVYMEQKQGHMIETKRSTVISQGYHADIYIYDQRQGSSAPTTTKFFLSYYFAIDPISVHKSAVFVSYDPAEVPSSSFSRRSTIDQPTNLTDFINLADDVRLSPLCVGCFGILISYGII